MSKHRYNGKWISAEEMKEITLARQAGKFPSEVQNMALENEGSESTQVSAKLSKKEVVAELKALGVKFKANAKVADLIILLNQTKSTQESEQ